MALNDFSQLEKFLEKYKLKESCADIIQFSTLITQLSFSDFIKYDPTIVRGLDYYTGIVFEVFDIHPDNNRAIAGGGAYANLLQIFNESPLAGVGFGLGDVTLRDFLETHKLLKDFTKAENDLLLVYTNANEEIETFKIAQQLRQTSLKIETNLGAIKFNKIFKLAESKGYSYIGIVESKDDTTIVQIKNLTDNSTNFYSLSEVEKIRDFIK